MRDQLYRGQYFAKSENFEAQCTLYGAKYMYCDVTNEAFQRKMHSNIDKNKTAYWTEQHFKII